MTLSFCLGLLVFYAPERPYRVVPSAWLPQTNGVGQTQQLNLPVAYTEGIHGRVQFVGRYVASPVLVEMSAKAGAAAICPGLFGIQSDQSARCTYAGRAGADNIYSVRRRSASIAVEAYVMHQQTLLAVSGFYDQVSAVHYLQSLVEVPRRDVHLWLQANQHLVAVATGAWQAAQRQAWQSAATAYQHIPFDTALPAVLPADWVLQFMRIEGSDSSHPNQVAVYFKKGPERVMSLTMVPASSIRLGATCGPVPDTSILVDCSKADGQDYYAGGYNQGAAMSWLLFRPLGNTMAVLQVAAYNGLGQPLTLSTQDLAAQKMLAGSLQRVSKDRFKGAVFAGLPQNDYPELQPRP